MSSSADLAAVLQGEIVAVERFIELLKSEQSMLRDGITAPLTALGQEKSVLITELGKLAQARNAALGTLGLAADRPGLSSWATRNGPAANGLCERLLVLAAEAKELNRLNGQLIGIRLNQTQDAINALSIERPGTAVYGRDGQSSGRTGYRIIDSA